MLRRLGSSVDVRQVGWLVDILELLGASDLRRNLTISVVG